MPCDHDERSSVRDPFCRAATRTSRTTSSNTKRISSTVARVRDVPAGLLDDAQADAGDEGHGRLTMAPTSAAISARSSSSGLSTSVRMLVWPGAARMAVKADSAPARVQATVEVRRTHTPDRRAESAFSAVARMARPQGENRMKAASAERHERGHDEGEHLSRA